MNFVYFEDAEIGDTRTAGPYPVSKDEIMEFAKKYDAQPFHIDEEAAARSVFKGLTASAAHTFAILISARQCAEMPWSRSFIGLLALFAHCRALPPPGASRHPPHKGEGLHRRCRNITVHLAREPRSIQSLRRPRIDRRGPAHPQNILQHL
jgi:hypothetical protein